MVVEVEMEVKVEVEKVVEVVVNYTKFSDELFCQ